MAAPAKPSPSPVRLLFFSATLALVTCPPPAAAITATTTPACDGGILEVRPGSTLDYGSTGLAHGNDPGTGMSFGFAVQRRCADDEAPCYDDEDCDGSECLRTCDCVSDTTCEITGPLGGRRCANDLSECSTNNDCAPSISCLPFSGPPLPRSSGGTPICIVSDFDAPLTGTMDIATGEMNLSSTLRWRVFLGITIDRPCPRCGSPAQAPQIGDVFVCDGGPRDGQACTVDGVSVEFGGTSYDCPPDLGADVSGSAITIPLAELSTGTVTRTARLPCKSFGFTGNPTVPGSNPKCLDKRALSDPVCTSNADCTRCTGDSSLPCTSNSDCTGAGTCAEAPDQPVTCGFWCNCGFCNNNAKLPCFETGDCPDGQVCQQGTGTGTQPNAPQQRPNECSGDKFICGGEEKERCATSTQGTCSDKPFYTCSTDGDCAGFNAGLCTIQPKPCFEPRMTRTGVPSPLGTYCAFEDKTCTSNTDCTGEGDFCVEDSARPQTVALFCMPATSSSTVNSAAGITGPGALEWNTFLRMCRCDVDSPVCEEFCNSDLDPCGPDDDGKPCDDGLWCNGADTCGAGTCSQHSGKPCPGPGDGDLDCSESCEEASRTCNGNDPDGSFCTDFWPCTVGDECASGTCVLGPLDGACACGDWTRNGLLTASDAQGVLYVAVGIHPCAPWICDYDGSGMVTTSDALAVLRASVGQPATPSCPPPS